MIKAFYLLLGLLSLLVGAIGVVVPMLPTVPFILLAAFFFARSNARLERWLLDHPRFGPHIGVWRTRRAISRKGKRAAILCFAASGVLGFVWLSPPAALLPVAAALAGGTWIWTRADA